MAELIDADMMARIEQLRLIARRMATGRMRGERRSDRRGMSTDFADYRNYVSGDDIRHLDWKIYARLERLCLKLFMEEEDLNIYILIDTSASMDLGEPNKLHYAKQVAAALGYMAMNNMDSLTVHCFGHKIVQSYGPKRGRAHSKSLFNFLNEQSISYGTSLEESLRVFSQTTRGKGIVILLSDFYDFDGYEEGLRYLFGRSFDVYVMQLLSPEEIKPDLKGDVSLVDVELDYKTDISVGNRLLDLYDQTLNTFTLGIRDYVMKRGGLYQLVPTDLPFDRLVMDILCRKGLIK